MIFIFIVFLSIKTSFADVHTLQNSYNVSKTSGEGPDISGCYLKTREKHTNREMKSFPIYERTGDTTKYYLMLHLKEWIISRSWCAGDAIYTTTNDEIRQTPNFGYFKWKPCDNSGLNVQIQVSENCDSSQWQYPTSKDYYEETKKVYPEND